MRRPTTMRGLEDLGRTRLSRNFFLRDFLHSEIASLHGFSNIPDDPDLAIAAGTRLCQDLLEPLWDRFGRISIRSAFRSAEVNDFGNRHKLNCSANEKNFAGHIWDRRDAQGRMGATASIVVHAVLPYYERTGHWEAIAWWDASPLSSPLAAASSPPPACPTTPAPTKPNTPPCWPRCSAGRRPPVFPPLSPAGGDARLVSAAN